MHATFSSRRAARTVSVVRVTLSITAVLLWPDRTIWRDVERRIRVTVFNSSSSFEG